MRGQAGEGQLGRYWTPRQRCRGPWSSCTVTVVLTRRLPCEMRPGPAKSGLIDYPHYLACSSRSEYPLPLSVLALNGLPQFMLQLGPPCGSRATASFRDEVRTRLAVQLGCRPAATLRRTLRCHLLFLTHLMHLKTDMDAELISRSLSSSSSSPHATYEAVSTEKPAGYLRCEPYRL